MGPETLAAVAAATALGALLQSAGGFGFALVAGPALFAALSPHEAVGTLLVLGAGLNLLVLLGERRPTDVRRSDVGPMIACAVPGVAAGVAILDALPKPTLQVLVGAGVLSAAGAQAVLRAEPAPHHPAGRASSYPVGLLAGTLTTATSVNGPPLVLWLRARGARPGELRDSLAASFLALNALGAVALALLGGAGRAFDPAVIALLAPVTVVGHAAGRRVFTRLPARRFHALGLALVVAAGTASVAAGMA
ncbi:MAG: sulfite exporter TauE/SafE family protein [Thermoleophilaceae bacterium]